MELIQSTPNSGAYYIFYVKLKIPDTSCTAVLIKASDMFFPLTHPLQNPRFIE
jgi:hypothetical protein